MNHVGVCPELSAKHGWKEYMKYGVKMKWKSTDAKIVCNDKFNLGCILKNINIYSLFTYIDLSSRIALPNAMPIVMNEEVTYEEEPQVYTLLHTPIWL